MKSADKIDRYVDATREVEAWQRTIATEGETPARKESLKMAKARRTEYERTLTGGELGRARRILAGRAVCTQELPGTTCRPTKHAPDCAYRS